MRLAPAHPSVPSLVSRPFGVWRGEGFNSRGKASLPGRVKNFQAAPPCILQCSTAGTRPGRRAQEDPKVQAEVWPCVPLGVPLLSQTQLINLKKRCSLIECLRFWLTPEMVGLHNVEIETSFCVSVVGSGSSHFAFYETFTESLLWSRHAIDVWDRN